MAQLNTRPIRTSSSRSGGAQRLKKMYYVYVLYSVSFQKYYVGLTNNLDRRLLEHNQVKMTSTKAFVPWIIVHTEVFETRPEARMREKYLKSAAGRKWRKQHIRPRGATE
ncbi:MAG: GIY-YIG nuclease family protein [Flavobacteriaceae bacterium]|nr:GIY-YIG nuclease family protein [Flavobacteriaceae bacterium]